MKSKFTYKAFLFPVLATWLVIASISIIINNYPIDIFKLRWIDYFMTILFLIAFVMLLKIEIFKRMLHFEISETSITTNNVIYKKRIYNFSNLIGFKTQINSSRMGNFEETIIMVNDKSNIILSELYITNYIAIKNEITRKLKNFGGARKFE